MLDYEVQVAVNLAELQAAEKLLRAATVDAEKAAYYAKFSATDSFAQNQFSTLLLGEIQQIASALASLRDGISRVISQYLITDFEISERWQNIVIGKYAVLGLGRFLNMVGILEEGKVDIFRATSFEITNPRTLEQLVARIPAGDAQVLIEKYEGNIDSEGMKGSLDEPASNTFIVYISGTREWGLTSDNAFDLTSNLALANEKYAGSLQGVEAAMFKSGISAEDRVILVGYSQGGMVASALAGMNKYRVSHLVTFGSPALSVADTSKGVANKNSPKIISVVHRDDLVPKLLGPSPQDGRIIVNADSVPDISAHDLGGYRKTAQEIDLFPSSEIVELQKELRNLPEKAAASTWHVTRAD